MKFTNATFLWVSLAICLCLISGCGEHQKPCDHGGDSTYHLASQKKPVIKVFMENSGSMNAYVNGETEFEAIVYNYLVNLKISRATDSLCLYYINSLVLPQPDDVRDFIAKLEPASFKQQGGNLGSSDMAQMMDSIFADLDDQSVCIFISDGIFSPGKKRDASQYLTNQQIGIKNVVGKYFNEHPRLAVVGYRCISDFDGKYFDKYDTPSQYKGKRPFFIWLFGSQEQIKFIENTLSKQNCAFRQATHQLVCFGGGITLPGTDYCIVHNSGTFDKDKGDPRHRITSWRKGNSGKASFAVQVNFSPLLLNRTYLCNPANYVLSNPQIHLVKVEEAADNNYTHKLIFEADRPQMGNLNVQLKAASPQWPTQYNDKEGVALSPANEELTFGLQYMANGFCEAILRKPFYVQFNVEIKK